MIFVPVDARSESIGPPFVYAFRSYLRIPSLMLEVACSFLHTEGIEFGVEANPNQGWCVED